MATTEHLRDLADSILYVCALLRDRPRPIDRYIDYFGGASRGGSYVTTV